MYICIYILRYNIAHRKIDKRNTRVIPTLSGPRCVFEKNIKKKKTRGRGRGFTAAEIHIMISILKFFLILLPVVIVVPRRHHIDYSRVYTGT